MQLRESEQAVDGWYVARLDGVDAFALGAVRPPRVLRHTESRVNRQALRGGPATNQLYDLVGASGGTQSTGEADPQGMPRHDLSRRSVIAVRDDPGQPRVERRVRVRVASAGCEQRRCLTLCTVAREAQLEIAEAGGGIRWCCAVWEHRRERGVYDAGEVSFRT
eukprot:2088500-Pleurochrysis_carterae.AAC.1